MELLGLAAAFPNPGLGHEAISATKQPINKEPVATVDPAMASQGSTARMRHLLTLKGFTTVRHVQEAAV